MKKRFTFLLPEPEALREMNLPRRRFQRPPDRIGWGRYLQELNSRRSVLAEPAPLGARERTG
jgi:hypothetical protein